MRFFLPTVLLLLPIVQGAQPWPLQVPFTVMNTLSNLEDYGGTPGFHHGIDLQVPAGTEVYAPLGGEITMDYYYPREKNPYTFRVVIVSPDGLRWELHHVDPGSITEEVRDLVDSGGMITEGIRIGRIADAEPFGLPSHLHLEIIDRQGQYQNPLRFLPSLNDDVAPIIHGVYIIRASTSKTVAQEVDGKTRGSVPLNGQYELIINVTDQIPPGTWGNSLYSLEVMMNGTQIDTLLFNRLADPDYLKGVADVYRIDPFMDMDGKQVANQIELGKPRQYLFRVPFTAPPDVEDVRFQVSASDFARNLATESVTLPVH